MIQPVEQPDVSTAREQQPEARLSGGRTAVLPAIVCIALMLVFGLFFAALAIQQHRTYLTHGLDIGNVDQALWNTARGRFLHFTLMAPIESRLALHVEPILLLFVPFYGLNLGSPELLLVAQAIVVALGAWPVYQLAVHHFRLAIFQSQAAGHIRHPAKLAGSFIYLLALLLAVVYLMLPTLQSAVLFDFHAVTMAPTFLLFALLFLDQRRDRLFFLFIILALACKEDMPLVVATVGLYAGVALKRWRLAGLTIGLSLAWFVVALFFVQPRFAPGGNIQLDRYAWLGDTPIEMGQNLITSPQILIDHLQHRVELGGYLAALFFPTAYLALLSPLSLLPMLPTLAENLLSDNPFTWRLEDFHYGAPLVPFLVLSTILGIRWLVTWAGRRPVVASSSSSERISILLLAGLTLLVVLFSSIYHFQRGYTPLARPFAWPQLTNHHRLLDNISGAVPPDASLFAQSNLAPHLSQRAIIYSDFAYFTDPDFPAEQPVDHIVIDVSTLENFGGLHEFLQQTLLTSNDYQLVAARDGIVHYKYKLSSQVAPGQVIGPQNGSAISSAAKLADPFYTFVRPLASLENDLPVEFGEVVRLDGYTLHFDRQEEIQVTLDLELLQPSSSFKPVLYLLDSTGQPVGATVDLPPALVWYPVERWTVGERVRIHFNTLPWHTRETGTYGLALGIAGGPDEWEPGTRLRPSIRQPTAFASRLPADGTLVELARIEQQSGMPAGGPQMRQYAPPVMENAVDETYEDQIRLLGYDRPQIHQAQPAESELSLTLYWQAITAPESLTRFVHLVGPDGQVYGQHDSAPDSGNYPTNLWQPGEVVAEVVTFPIRSDRPGDSHWLHVGLYRTPAGDRLRLDLGEDHIEFPLTD